MEKLETEIVDRNADWTSKIICAYVSNNPVSTNELPKLISEVYGAVKALGEKPARANNTKPAVPIKRSVQDDYIICLEDGKKFKSLKRHLMAHFDLTPEQYRAKWGLAADYPMTAPSYAKARSKLARDMGLGRKPGTKIKKRRAVETHSIGGHA